MKTLRKTDSRCGKHRGIAAVEFAVCLPAVLLLFVGSIECASMVFLRQTLSVSAYEGARKAIQFDSTNGDVIANSNNILTSRQVDGASITLNPTDVSAVPTGTQIGVTVSAPCSSNSVLPLKFFNDYSITVTTTMVKE